MHVIPIKANPTVLLATIVIACWSLSGCAGMGAGYETPTVSVQSFRPLPSDDGSGLPQFEIVLHVINPNLEPLELAGVSYTISLNGQELNLMAGIRLFRSLMEKDGGGFDYRFEAKLDPGAFKRKIRISDSGTISLSGA